MKGIAGEVCCIHEVIGHAWRIHRNDLILIGRFIDDLHQVAAVGAPEDMNLFLEDHPLADLLALIRLTHVIGFDHLNQLLFAVHPDAAPLVDVMGYPLNCSSSRSAH